MMIKDRLKYIYGKTQQRGMILLFAVLLGGSALLVATGVFTLIFSQVQINQNVQESYQAYYNGDLVMECLEHYLFTPGDPNIPRNFWSSADLAGIRDNTICLSGNITDCKIECAGVLTAIHSAAVSPGVVDGQGVVTTQQDDFSFTDPFGVATPFLADRTCYKFDINQGNLCAHVEIDNRYICGTPPCNSGSGFEERTEIHVFGRNSCAEGAHQVQRYIEYTHCAFGGECTIPPNEFCDAVGSVP